MKKIILTIFSFAIAIFATNSFAFANEKNCKHNGKNHSHHKKIKSQNKIKTQPINNKPIVKIDESLKSCKANELQNIIGQNRNILSTMRFSQPIRIEEDGMMYTMEYSAQRLRIILDENGKIKNLMCG